MYKDITGDADFTNQAADMKEYFRVHGYPDELVNNNLRNVPTTCSSLLKSTPTSHDESTNTKVPLVLTYNPFNVGTRWILLDNFNILSSNPEARRIFPEPPLVLYRPRFACLSLHFYTVGYYVLHFLFHQLTN